MGRFREHNQQLLEDWLQGYRDRFPSGPQEMLRVENRKLESKSPAKGANYIRLQDRPYYTSDQVLLKLIVLLRDFHFDLYQALSAPYLNPDTSVSEIDRLKRKATLSGIGAQAAREELRKIRKAKSILLDWLEMVHTIDDDGVLHRGHKLAFPRIDRAPLKEIAVSKDRQDTIRAEFLEHYDECGNVPEAIRRTQKTTDHKKSWLYHITKGERARLKEESA